MNIEKVKSYNQKVLAGLGTLVVLFGIVGLIAVAHEVIEDIERDSYYENEVKGILSDEEIKELQQKSMRQQLISYKDPILLDTLKTVYMIPVGHKDLNEPEHSGLLTIEGSFNERGIEIRYDHEHYGDYNNLLIYDVSTNENKKLFNSRVNFTKIGVEYFEDDILVLMNAASEDTHKNGVINLDDYKALFVYSLKEDRLRKVTMPEKDLISYEFIHNTKDLIIHFGVDHNKDGQHVSGEPIVLMRYDFKNEKLDPIVGNELDIELQKMLEGL